MYIVYMHIMNYMLFDIFRNLDWRRRWHPTPILLPGESHGRRSLVGCSPWGREESDTTERLYFHFSLSCIGEGNGNPLQCSCLENPKDRGARWASIYGVAQSRTRLKQLRRRRRSSWLHVGSGSPGVASVGCSLLRCAGFSLCWPLSLWTTGSRHVGFSSCSTWVQ